MIRRLRGFRAFITTEGRSSLHGRQNLDAVDFDSEEGKPTMTAAQPCTSTRVTQVAPGGNEGSRKTSAQRSPAAARGNLDAPPEVRLHDPRIGGSGGRS